MSNSPGSSAPKWLKDLQQKSWEPEILLSGIVLYGMFQLPGYLDEFLAYFKLNIYGSSNDFDNMVAVFKVGIYWLIVGLILHLVSRSVWVGMVGLSYSFPKGVSKEKLSYKGRFDDRVNRMPSIIHTINQLEKVSSSLFSLSFMLFMSLIGGYLYMLILVIVPFLVMVLFFGVHYSSQAAANFQFYAVPVVLIGAIAVFDFVTLGLLKKIKWLERVYWPVQRVMSVLTLSRFYRNVYYVFASNVNKWWLSALLITFLFTSFLGAALTNSDGFGGDSISRLEIWERGQGGLVYPGNYDDQSKGKGSSIASIQSDIIDQGILKLFIVADIKVEGLIKDYVNYDSMVIAHPQMSKRDRNLMTIEKFYHIYIDDSLKLDYKLLFHYNTATEQKGYLAYVDVSYLQRGLHNLKLAPSPSLIGDGAWSIIEFYKTDASNSVSQEPCEIGADQ